MPSLRLRHPSGRALGRYPARLEEVLGSTDHRAAIVGSPAYFKTYPKPKAPRDLLSHKCTDFRHGHGGHVYRWEFEKGKKSLSVAVNGPLIVDDVEIMIRAALDGIGLAFAGEDKVAQHLASGKLIRVLEDWCQPFPGFFLYYLSRRQQPAALAALISTLRLCRLPNSKCRIHAQVACIAFSTISASDVDDVGTKFVQKHGDCLVSC
jgi:DNA-binding transcriptional LysR family regulator